MKGCLLSAFICFIAGSGSISLAQKTYENNLFSVTYPSAWRYVTEDSTHAFISPKENPYDQVFEFVTISVLNNKSTDPHKFESEFMTQKGATLKSITDRPFGKDGPPFVTWEYYTHGIKCRSLWSVIEFNNGYILFSCNYRDSHYLPIFSDIFYSIKINNTHQIFVAETDTKPFFNENDVLNKDGEQKLWERYSSTENQPIRNSTPVDQKQSDTEYTEGELLRSVMAPLFILLILFFITKLFLSIIMACVTIPAKNSNTSTPPPIPSVGKHHGKRLSKHAFAKFHIFTSLLSITCVVFYWAGTYLPTELINSCSIIILIVAATIGLADLIAIERRARDAGVATLWNILFFVPGANFICFIILFFLPTKYR
ncbi:MAG: DUF805 domain-containing protein [Pontiellaceae bacterium]|nr:DUF805 domain-containing protein [Pontiellaceae bacterium]